MKHPTLGRLAPGGLQQCIKSTAGVQRHFEALLRALVPELKRYYADRLVSVVVYGSVGRGVARADSDVDLLLVIDPLPDGRLRRVDEFAPVKRALRGRLDRLADAGIHATLAPVFKTRAEVRRGSLLFLDMIDDGRILLDRGGFWKDYMRGFQERLRRLGARKVSVGDRWYWDLKPDYKVGEVFDI